MEKPETARPENSAMVLKVESTQGMSSLMWKVSQFRGPALEATGLQYQPAEPPSGMTTMSSRPAVRSRMPSLSKALKSAPTPPPWRR